MNQHHQVLDQRIQEFRRKYYLDKIIRGSLVLALLMSSILFVALISESLFGFSSAVRTGMVFLLGTTFAGVLGYMVLWPVSQLMKITRHISDLQVADMVKGYFPEINDKLINWLQLRRQSDASASLAMAALDRKASEIAPVQLSSAINLQVNRKYIWYLLLPISLYLLTYFADSSFLTAGAHRLMNYNKTFIPAAPFQINLKEIPNKLVAGSNYQIQVHVEGNQLPAELFLYVKNEEENGSRFIDFSLDKISATDFEYTLSDLKQDFTFYIGNPEARTEAWKVEIIKRPFIRNFRIRVDYPDYTGLPAQYLEENVGDFKALRGSAITWELTPQGEVKEAAIVSKDGKSAFSQRQGSEKYEVNRRLMQDMEYFISLTSSEDISNLDTVRYKATALQDRFPSIYVISPGDDFQVDLDPVMPLDVELGDDFGFSKLAMYYRFTKSGGASSTSTEYKEYPLTIEARTLLQPRSFSIDLSSLGFQEGDELEYFVKVWDNDGIAGPKFSISPTFKAVYPTLEARYDEIEKQKDEVRDDLQKLKDKAEMLEQSYKKMQEKLLEQKKLSFDDKKEMQNTLQQHQEMMKQIDQTQQKFEETKEKLQENQMVSEQTLQKQEDLNKFLDELKDPELQKLMEEIQQKMENMNPEDFREKLERLKQKDEDMKKSLERTLELLKQLEVQEKIDEVRNKIDNLQSKENLLNEQLEKAETPEQMKDLSQRQEELGEKMDAVQKDLEELKEMKSETQTPDEAQMEETIEDSEQAESEMDKAAQEMEKAAESQEEGSRQSKKESQQQKSNASKSQKSASDKMQEMSDQLSQMQQDSQSQQDEENMENLRALLENLLKLSFDQEDLRDGVSKLRYGDPALLARSQQQKKLQDDMALVQDSLESLANRVFQIQKFVLDESQKIEKNMNESQVFFRNKQISMITFHQQSAMTSINNLANMLSDVMKQMQQQMMNAKPGQGMCQKPGGKKPNMQGMSQKQKQLNQQMQDMMKGQMDGDKLSQMAAQQEAIRKELEEAKKQMGEQGDKALGDLDKIMQDMKDSETDLINKRLTEETMLRQQQILNRMLQADQSVRQQEMDNERESRTGQIADRKSPADLSKEELQNRIRQEMLKSNKLDYSSDFIILIEQYFKKLEGANE
ncbi:MAG: hypothetical protein EAZ89_10930 [Bacteroidetes bacterium]|nr:MAG: hypothetical protein EAZ89_10930 [Bacteroidota bacterium]